ncbi:hypothetical protein LINPERPRIM_LOCUS5297, partial [Linum perenne]
AADFPFFFLPFLFSQPFSHLLHHLFFSLKPQINRKKERIITCLRIVATSSPPSSSGAPAAAVLCPPVALAVAGPRSTRRRRIRLRRSKSVAPSVEPKGPSDAAAAPPPSDAATALPPIHLFASSPPLVPESQKGLGEG